MKVVKLLCSECALRLRRSRRFQSYTGDRDDLR
jgi:hypothetical protein